MSFTKMEYDIRRINEFKDVQKLFILKNKKIYSFKALSDNIKLSNLHAILRKRDEKREKCIKMY